MHQNLDLMRYRKKPKHWSYNMYHIKRMFDNLKNKKVKNLRVMKVKNLRVITPYSMIKMNL